MKHQNEQQKLKALVRDLERELAQGKSQVESLEETHERLRQTEGICQELADENRRLREEITDWQKRFAASEENQREIVTLRQQLDTLQAEHMRLIDSDRQTREKLTADNEAGKISSHVENETAEANIPQGNINMVAGLASDLIGSGEGNHHPAPATDLTAKIRPAKETKLSQMVWSLIVRNWHFGAIFAGVMILIMIASVSVKMLRSEAPSSSSTIAFSPETTTVEQATRPVSTPPVTAAPRIRGTFQTVRRTQVFSGPSEDSALIVNIDKGTKVNVVDSRDGWLEIRSKHGRPPGFIRQEATVRIGRD